MFFDTTRTYFEVGEDDEGGRRDENGNATDDEQKAAEGKPAGLRGSATRRITATTCRRS